MASPGRRLLREAERLSFSAPCHEVLPLEIACGQAARSAIRYEYRRRYVGRHCYLSGSFFNSIFWSWLSLFNNLFGLQRRIQRVRTDPPTPADLPKYNI
jgi:hypothetical protein